MAQKYGMHYALCSKWIACCTYGYCTQTEEEAVDYASQECRFFNTVLSQEGLSIFQKQIDELPEDIMNSYLDLYDERIEQYFNKKYRRSSNV